MSLLRNKEEQICKKKLILMLENKDEIFETKYLQQLA